MIELSGTFQAWLQQQKDQVVNLDSYSPKPLQCQKIPICYDDDDEEESSTPLRDIIISKLPPCIAITPVLSTKETKDSLIMRDVHLDTFPKKEFNEFIKSSVENLVPNLSEAEDENSLIIASSKIDSLLDEFTSKLIFLKSIPPEFNSENFDAVIESFSPYPIPFKDSDPFMEEIDLFLTSDGSIPPGIDSDYSDSEGDNLFPKRLLHNDPIPLSDILDFSNIVQNFPPFFTYQFTSSILLSSGSEDIIFDPSISNYHFSSFEPDVSYRSGTFMKFNVYPNHLNESPMEILSSTCSPMDQ
uniref:Reverse transcriptase domain-containing protein n=1 Tax=Tanacetum cinerariifolium TaxID=118510 RepID=A0A6L2KCB3_TANCI|nr:hypothetical protein [Tanacetum cinerariifolium]